MGAELGEKVVGESVIVTGDSTGTNVGDPVASLPILKLLHLGSILLPLIAVPTPTIVPPPSSTLLIASTSTNSPNSFIGGGLSTDDNGRSSKGRPNGEGTYEGKYVDC